MDKSLQALCHTLKHTVGKLTPQATPLSFLLLIGKDGQGKTALLRQSQFQHVAVNAERPAEIYYNAQGILLELGESWINQSNSLLQHTLKQLNRCNKHLRISGILLCVDLSDLFIQDQEQLTQKCKTHVQLLHRFGQSLSCPLDLGILFTKVDALAGFCEFFQYEQLHHLDQPLGFSLHPIASQAKLLETFKTQFEHFIETLGQQVINKIHPVRSSLMRTLIREFPLQLASLRRSIWIFIQLISPRYFNLQAMYFTSAEQGGISMDRLNQRIEHEYALVVQDQFPQATNYRAYFIAGALQAFQCQTKQMPVQATQQHHWLKGAIAAAASLGLFWVGYQYYHSSKLLDEASKELLEYEISSNHSTTDTPAIYHLAKASASLNKMSSDLATPTIQYLQDRLRLNTAQHLQDNFLPAVLAELETTMTDAAQSQAARYQALKIYLMLEDNHHYVKADVLSWFQDHWTHDSPSSKQKRMELLKQVLNHRQEGFAINQQIVHDVRNYLNALPTSYLYYSLAKSHFPTTEDTIKIQGFDLAHSALPMYYTKAGFQTVVQQLPQITESLKSDNWVLNHADLDNLASGIQQAYCYDYIAWWQHFIKQTNPKRFQTYEQGRDVLTHLQKTKALQQLIALIQQQTSPDFAENSTLFNQEIASKFTFLSLLSPSSITALSANFSELSQFLNTLSVVHDQGQTAFAIVKARFQGDALSNPLSNLYTHAQQLPEPVSNWAKQIADDHWFILIHDSREYINQQWQKTVFNDYKNRIANRYPFDNTQKEEVSLADFDHFFATHGVFNQFMEDYLKPFMDTSKAQWKPKELNGYVLPISADAINEIIRANVITNMFFPDHTDQSKIEFSLQKQSLDPIVAKLKLTLGKTQLVDDQHTDSFTQFYWPEAGAKLRLKSIEGNHFDIEEEGPWAFFKMLQKVNVLVDEQDSSSLEILFEINGNSGRYVLKTQNKVNPFIPGILNGFLLPEAIV